MLSVSNLVAGYGQVQVLHGLDLEVPQGSLVTLIGSNGAGKTTTLRVLSGMIAPRSGSIRLAGKEIAGLPSHQIARRGMAHSPEGRRVFPSLTVIDNLRLGAFPRLTGARGRGDVRADLEQMFDLFPRLRERREQLAGTLSGGEQQMLAMARALVIDPRLLLLDEPLEGLAPIIVEELLRLIQALIRDEGVTVILVEQSATKILPLTQRALVLERGMIAYEGGSADLLADPEMMASLLGVAERKPAKH
jgi:branched-chain amino acid transport system ATP-binding protein